MLEGGLGRTRRGDAFGGGCGDSTPRTRRSQRGRDGRNAGVGAFSAQSSRLQGGSEGTKTLRIEAPVGLICFFGRRSGEWLVASGA